MTQSEFDKTAKEVLPLIEKTCRDFFPDAYDAYDAVQESLIRLWRWCEKMPACKNIDGLAVRTAKNCCVDLYRKQQSHAKLKMRLKKVLNINTDKEI